MMTSEKPAASPTRQDQAQKSFVQLFLGVGLAGGLLALIDSAFIKHSLDSLTLIFISGFIFICAVTMVVVQLSQRTGFARVVIHLSILAIILYALLNTNFGIFWLFLGPVVIILIERFRTAVILLSLNLGLILLVQFQPIKPSSYDNQAVFTAVMSILLISAGLLIYKRKYESINQAVYDQEKQLEQLTGKLQQEIVFENTNQHDLSEALSQLSAQNKELTSSRLALTNVLEDEQQLRTELEEAKAHIERQVEKRTAQLHAEHARLQATIESLPVGLVILNDLFQQFSCNKVVEQLIIGKKADHQSVDACPLLFSDLKLRPQLEASLKTKMAISLKEINYKQKVLRIHIAPIITRSEKASGVVVVVDDITEEKVMERSKEEFLSIASHELRTPLTTIRGNARLLDKLYQDKLDDKSFNELTEDIALSAERLLSIVNDYLETSSLEQGKISVHPETFSIEQAINQVLHELSTTAKQKQLYLKLTAPRAAKLPLAYADPKRVSQVLINLISNALHYTKSGGVTVHVAPTRGHKHLAISVTDTGAGISQDNQKLLFHKFQKADANILTRDWSRSTGLGLYISKLLVEIMGGKIKLKDSTVGQGSTFVFTLPVATEQSSRPASFQSS